MLNKYLDKRKQIWVLIGLVAVLSVMVINNVTSVEEEKAVSIKPAIEKAKYKNRMKSVLKVQPIKEKYVLPELSEDPFKSRAVKRIGPRKSAVIRAAPRNLRVKGIVGNGAMVSDGTGPAKMVKAGDMIGEFKVVRVGKNQVVFRDKSGEFTVEVK